MIKIGNTPLKKQEKFWNHALFHPSDAIEDAWGKRILDRMAKDGAIKTIRLYAMLEDIAYDDGEGGIAYDFRISDLRLDYLIEKGYDILLAYGGMPACIAEDPSLYNTAAKNSTRYKGKQFITSPPKDYVLWEELCYEYTKHLVERYGEERVSTWHCHCWNEPDGAFFMTNLKYGEYEQKSTEYCKLYDAFVRGVRRASGGIRVGGPALAEGHAFFDRFMAHVKESGVDLDYIALHTYGTGVSLINNGKRPIAVENHFKFTIDPYMEIIKKYGFEDTELIIDEWGASAQGYYNVEECPGLLFREHEVYSAYFTKFISRLIESGYPISKLMICLSGQHEMVTDFSGFRNFFTLNFIAKPIYNAHLMTSMLGDQLVSAEYDNQSIYTVPTKDGDGGYALLLTYCTDLFEEALPPIDETVSFAEDISDKTVSIYCIDKEHTNPYRTWERAGKPEIEGEFLKQLRDEGRLLPIKTQKGSEPISLRLSGNATYLITVKE